MMHQEVCTECIPTGVEILQDPIRNKGTAFDANEREVLRLRGLLPPHISSQEEQAARVMEIVRGKPSDLEKHLCLAALQDRNETLFYRVLMDHIEELMPIVYTPTAGHACQKYAHAFRRPRGLFLSTGDRGRMAEVLRNWPHKEVNIIAVTDGERILGPGDLGADSMGIPVGKLALYTACAGIDPRTCLPVTLDVGTETEALLADPLYIGLKQRRLRGQAYDDFIEEFVAAVEEVFPKAVLQFEGLADGHALRFLRKYRDRICTFSDDIQGTAAIVLAGLHSAMRITRGKLIDQRILFLGSGEAGVGIADLIVAGMVAEGLSEEEARQRCWSMDAKGLAVKGREDSPKRKRPFADVRQSVDDLHAAVRALKPTALVGVSGRLGTFSRSVLQAMAKRTERPMIFALSHPAAQAECTAEEAYAWTEGRAVFASGRRFDPVTIDGKTHEPGQGHRACLFPGVGLGLVASMARRATDEMFFEAAKALAREVSDADLERGRVYPPLSRIMGVSRAIANAVVAVACRRGLARNRNAADASWTLNHRSYAPRYRQYA